MSRKFAAFDVDGTLIRWQLYHAIADALVKLGHFDLERFNPVRTARQKWKQRDDENSFRAYEMQMVQSYEQTLKKLTVQQINEAIDLAFEEYKNQVYTFTRNLIAELKQAGYLLFAISNSQQEIVKKIADHYGFDDSMGAIYAKKGNQFTGQKTVYLTNKDQALDLLVKKHKASWQDSIAVGDSSSDIAMLKVVDRPIAFNPEKKLFQFARARGWEIIIERKNMVYELRQSDGKYVLA